MSIDISKLKVETIHSSQALGTTTVFFEGPKEMLNDKYPEADSASILMEFRTDKPHSQYPALLISPTKNGSDYDWNDLYIDDFDAVQKLFELISKGE